MTEHGMGNVSAAQLKSIVERIETIEADIAVRNTDKRDIYAEAKSNGFDTKVLKRVVAIRRQDEASRQEQETILFVYLQALGMEA